MDNCLEEILQKIEIHREKHPELMNMWSHYFNTKKKNFIEAVKNCDNMLKEIDQMQRFDEKSILLIYLLVKYNIINV